jgi:4-amino-4-deoxy-L-arabinose transferase-like glycosyltransferase
MSDSSGHNSPAESALAGDWSRRRLVGLALALLAGLALRVWWVLHFGQITYDSHVYGELARNAMQHHVYGFSNAAHGVTPSLIRLPGYPLFLAACFKLFGIENYIAVMLVQAVIDLWACLLIAGSAARLFGRRAGMAALWMAALCPFTANYVAVPLTEELTIFCIALAFYGLVRWAASLTEIETKLNATDAGKSGKVRDGSWGAYGWLAVVGCALAYAVLLRPWIEFRKAGTIRAALLVSVLTVMPLVPWTVRNWRVMHVVQPLAPRFAIDPGEPNPYGFQRWYRTWAVEFASTVTTYWEFVGDPIQIADLPNRAFDSNAQYEETEAAYALYDQTFKYSAAVDAQFAKIAQERIAADPIRYYVALPVGRVLDMMFRPRTEMLPVPVEWWKFKARGDWFSLAYAGLNLGFFVVAGVGFARKELWRESAPIVWAMVATMGMRVLLLLTIDNAEQRYTVEFFPVLIVLGAGVLGRRKAYLRR